ncbi:RNA-binding cell elongation regulator Jag/EloR [Ferroacidibacillus organovorans]|nr:RNA-binding cell elongation regulator Jag/EloR [Ferroacidibacillus organovorans]
MRQLTVTAKTVEGAIVQALQEFNTTRDKVDVVILQAPSRGIFGLGARPATVQVTRIVDPVWEAEQFLRELMLAMRYVVTVSVEKKGTDVYMEIKGDNVGNLIGRHGQTLDSLELLVQTVASRNNDRYLRFHLDIEGYRERREQTLIQLANRIADKSLVLKREFVLDPMPAHERKIIHLALERRADVRTESRGTDPKRTVVVIPLSEVASIPNQSKGI